MGPAQLLPWAKNQCAIDLVLAGGLPANVTVSATADKSIAVVGEKQPGLLAVCEQLRGVDNRSSRNFYVVVPPDIFTSDRSKGACRFTPAGSPNPGVKQYILEIPLE
jgi:hypothetical protein